MQSELNYYLQYSNWHNESVESKEKDISVWCELIELHNLKPENKDADILEIGCGMGRFLLAMQRYGYKNLKGVDNSKPLQEAALRENLDTECADGVEFLKQNNNKYDAIYCFDVLEHIPKENQPEFFTLIKRSLKENGFAVIRVPNALSPTASFFRYEDFTHVTSYTPVTIKFLAENAGFNYVVSRPEVVEDTELKELKAPFAEIYRKQFGLTDLILTPNIMSILFNDKNSFERYNATTPQLLNKYISGYENLNLKNLITYYLMKLFARLTFGRIKTFFNKRIPYKYEIVVKKTGRN